MTATSLYGLTFCGALQAGCSFFIRAVLVVHEADLHFVGDGVAQLLDDIKDVFRLRTVQHIRPLHRAERASEIHASQTAEFFDEVVYILFGNVPRKGDAVDEHSQLPLFKMAGQKIHAAAVLARTEFKARVFQKFEIPRHRLAFQHDPVLSVQLFGDLRLRQNVVFIAVFFQHFQNAQGRQLFGFKTHFAHICSSLSVRASERFGRALFPLIIRQSMYRKYPIPQKNKRRA